MAPDVACGSGDEDRLAVRSAEGSVMLPPLQRPEGYCNEQDGREQGAYVGADRDRARPQQHGDQRCREPTQIAEASQGQPQKP